ncbi:hypothetical protein Tco_0908371 [Tanacetum coccineum]|uniref:Uncharacterized protein n=1 Tax=Tanacetum coccineum TaxID=301880 RepID=A0ABQ5CQF0_9ASTR
MTNTRSRMTPDAFEEMINRHVAEALEAHEANRILRLENANDNGGGYGNVNDNGVGDGNANDNGGGNGNGNGGIGGNNGNSNGDHNGNERGDRPVARECTYQDFMKCQPLCRSQP